jgi:hypothetical protein
VDCSVVLQHSHPLLGQTGVQDGYRPDARLRGVPRQARASRIAGKMMMMSCQVAASSCGRSAATRALRNARKMMMTDHQAIIIILSAIRMRAL